MLKRLISQFTGAGGTAARRPRGHARGSHRGGSTGGRIGSMVERFLRKRR